MQCKHIHRIVLMFLQSHCQINQTSLEYPPCLRPSPVHAGFPLSRFPAIKLFDLRSCLFVLRRASFMTASRSWCTPSPRMQSHPQGPCSGARPSDSPARSTLMRRTPRTPHTPSPQPSCGPRSTASPCLPGPPALRRCGALLKLANT